MAACGADIKPEKKGPSLVGKWELDLNMTDIVKSSMSAQLGTEDVLPKDATMHVYMLMELNADSTYTFAVDAKKTGDSVEAYLDAMSETMVEYLYDMAEQQGMSKDAFEDAFEGQNGCTVEEYVENALDVIDMETLFSAIKGENGYYKENAGTIYMADDKEDLEDTDEYLTYTLTEAELTITGGADDTAAMESLEEMGIDTPLVFKRK